MDPAVKRGLHWVGSVVAIVGIVFVAVRLRNYGAEIDFHQFRLVEWLVVVALAIVYGVANLMLGLAWWNLLGYLGASTTRRWSIRAYGITQIGKYVPGNIFHLAGRQALGMSAGVGGWRLAKSTVWELGLLSVTGAIFGLLAMPLLGMDLTVFASSVIATVIMGVSAAVLWRFIGPSVVHAGVWYTVFLTVSGLVFVGLLALAEGSSEMVLENLLPLIGAYVLAWLVGLLTPGAPAGIGVRELVLLFLLRGMVSETDLLLAVVLGRLVTAMGDILFFAASKLASDGGAQLSIDPAGKKE